MGSFQSDMKKLLTGLRILFGLFFMGCVMAVTLFLLIDGNKGAMDKFVRITGNADGFALINLNPIFWLGVLFVSCWLLFCNEDFK